MDERKSKTGRLYIDGKSGWVLVWYERGHAGKVRSKRQRGSTRNELIEFAKKKRFTDIYDGTLASKSTPIKEIKPDE